MHISALYCASTDTLSCSHSQESSLCVYVCEKGEEKEEGCVCVCVRTQGGRSWLKFINFLPANWVLCAFFQLTNGADGEVGGGCCLATAGRISDHVEPIVLSLPSWEALHATCCIDNNNQKKEEERNTSLLLRHKVVNSICVMLNQDHTEFHGSSPPRQGSS